MTNPHARLVTARNCMGFLYVFRYTLYFIINLNIYTIFVLTLFIGLILNFCFEDKLLGNLEFIFLYLYL
jgi:hypothetical protein